MPLFREIAFSDSSPGPDAKKRAGYRIRFDAEQIAVRESISIVNDRYLASVARVTGVVLKDDLLDELSPLDFVLCIALALSRAGAVPESELGAARKRDWGHDLRDQEREHRHLLWMARHKRAMEKIEEEHAEYMAKSAAEHAKHMANMAAAEREHKRKMEDHEWIMEVNDAAAKHRGKIARIEATPCSLF